MSELRPDEQAAKERAQAVEADGLIALPDGAAVHAYFKSFFMLLERLEEARGCDIWLTSNLSWWIAFMMKAHRDVDRALREARGKLKAVQRCDDCADSPEGIRLPAGYRCYFCDKQFCGPHAKLHFKGDRTSAALAEVEGKLEAVEEFRAEMVAAGDENGLFSLRCDEIASRLGR